MHASKCITLAKDYFYEIDSYFESSGGFFILTGVFHSVNISTFIYRLFSLLLMSIKAVSWFAAAMKNSSINILSAFW